MVSGYRPYRFGSMVMTDTPAHSDILETMKVGLKVSLREDTRERIRNSRPEMCEVWFDATRPDDYSDMFGFLKSSGLDVGLHFWGRLPDGVLANLSYPDRSDLERSRTLYERTVDLAARYRFSYVNIHPGYSARVAIDASFEKFSVRSQPIPSDESISVFLEHVNNLNSYAQHRHVTLTVETVPARVTDGWTDPGPRQQTQNIYELPLAAIEQAAKSGIVIANDFNHTAAHVMTDRRDTVREYVQAVTERLAPHTRLIHAGFLIAPYNGTDMHDTFLGPKFRDPGAVPNEDELRRLIRIFVHRDDVWMLAEPSVDHIGNYRYLRSLVDSLRA